jgi:hypothetical protein
MKKAIALLLLIFSELSGAMDGNTLLKACTDEDHSNDKAICMGYVVAVADALNVGISGDQRHAFRMASRTASWWT